MADGMLNFELPQERNSIIKVIGVGGGGSNAVNYMYHLGIKDVNFAIVNTDSQALNTSEVPIKIRIGESLTEGRGAGNKPDIGREAAQENMEDIVQVLRDNAKMVFVTAGMGGGTGTGAAPEIAKAAKELGILTVGIVTIPFRFEGKKRLEQAVNGVKEMSQHVDSLIVIDNEKLRDMYGDSSQREAFAKADNILAVAAKGIAEIITVPGFLNVDFADVQTVMTDSGVALMGSAQAEGENRAVKAIQNALTSPLLNNNDISGTRNILLNITSGKEEVTMDEIGIINEYVQEASGYTADLIWGSTINEQLGDQISVTVVVTGFETDIIPQLSVYNPNGKEVITLPHKNEPAKAQEPPAQEKKKSAPAKEPVKDIPHKQNPDKQSPTNYPPITEAPVARPQGAAQKNERFDPAQYNKKLELYEEIPAYKRKGIALDDTRHINDSDTEISRFSLSNDDE